MKLAAVILYNKKRANAQRVCSIIYLNPIMLRAEAALKTTIYIYAAGWFLA